MSRRLTLATAVAALALVTASGATLPQRGAQMQPVHADVVLGFTSSSGNLLNVAGLATAQPFGRGGISARITLSGATTSGPLAIFDGRGSLKGTIESTTEDGQNYSGTYTVAGGRGRYAHATGTLRFQGHLDSSSVPLVTVLPGNLDGSLRVDPSAPPRPATKPVAVHLAGEQAKVKAVEQSDHIDLTTAASTSRQGLGPGVALILTKVTGARTRPQKWTFYGPNRTWRAHGVRDLDSSSPTRLTVDGGTGRYRGAHGTLLYRVSGDGSGSGTVTYTLDGRLRF